MSFSYLSICNVDGYNVTNSQPPEPPPTDEAWEMAGLWTKIEGYQQNNNNWFPTNYRTNPNAAANVDTVYGQLDRFLWYKGIQYLVKWADIDNGDVNPANWNWGPLDTVVNMIRDLFTISGRESAKFKKIMFLLSYKAFSQGAIGDILPADLQTFNAGNPYPNGATRYHYAMGFNSGAGGNVVNGYMLRLQDFNNGLTGLDKAGDPIYTLRDRYYKFLQALYDRYKNNPAFAGFCNTEGEPNDANKYYVPSEFTRTQWFTGRFKLLQKAKSIFVNHFVADAISLHDDALLIPTQQDWQTLKDYGIAFTNPNYHLGLNLQSLHPAADNLANVVPIINSCQPLDMSSKTGFTKRGGSLPNDVYNFLPNPPNYGQPRTAIENPNFDANGNLISFDPPDMPWVIHRAIYLKSNILIYQHNYAETGNFGAPEFNWRDFYQAVNNNTTVISPNTGGLIQFDRACGMPNKRPLYVGNSPP